MVNCNVQYLHAQLISFTAVKKLIMVALDDAAGKLMETPFNCMVTVPSMPVLGKSGTGAGRLSCTGNSAKTGFGSSVTVGNSETMCSRIFLSQ